MGLRKRRVRICLGALALVLLPSQIGLQDLGALLAHQPGVIERAREHLIASPFGTIHAAMFSLPRPIGTAIPHPPIYALANFDPADITGSIGAAAARRRFGAAAISDRQPQGQGQFAHCAAARSRCRLCRRCRRSRRYRRMRPTLRSKQDTAHRSLCRIRIRRAGASRARPMSRCRITTCRRKVSPRLRPDEAGKDPVACLFRRRSARLGRKGHHALGAGRSAGGYRQPWRSRHQAIGAHARRRRTTEGQSIAGKGEVTGEGARPHSPAERLGLGRRRARQGGEVPCQRGLFRSARRDRCAGRSRLPRW